MGKKLFFSLLLSLFWGSMAFAGYFEFVDPVFEEKVLTEEVENGESILININTVAVDNHGNVFYLKSDLSRILEESESFTFEEMEEIEYSVKIAGIDLLGEESVFAEGKFPLKTSIAGMFFDGGVRRLLVFLKTIEINEDCPFLSPNFSMEGLGSRSSTPFEENQEKKVWNWSGLENCIYEKLSIIEITGFGRVTPF
jgi:hypothetical protein